MRVTAAVMEEGWQIQPRKPRTRRAALRRGAVRITATGICQTDLHARDGYFAMPYPAVYGHEGAGVVAAIGSAVEHLAMGDHVVISFPWCGECEHCRDDRRSYCQRGRELKSGGARADGSTTMRRNGAPVCGSFFQQSSFATHALTPARNPVKVRRDAPLEFLGPLGCGLQTGAGAVLNVMKSEAGKSFAVFGAGSVGLAGLMAAKLSGCDPIIAVDIRANRLELARSLGATHAIDNARHDAVAKIRAITGGAHFTLETSASPAVFRQAVDCLLTRGTCVLVGSAPRGTEVSFEMSTLQAGRTVRGIIQGDSRPDQFIPDLVDLFVAGRFPIDRRVTFYDFALINQAAADAVSGATIKPVLRMPQ